MQTATETDDAQQQPARGLKGFAAYWGPPVLLGLLAGGLIVGGWHLVRKLRTSPVDGIVARWFWHDSETNDRLATEIAALGPSARGDLLAAFRGAPDLDQQVWIAQRLLAEPFFERKALVEFARSGTGAAHRAAAVALALDLREEADPDLVMPGVVEWLTDMEVDSHELAIAAAAALGPLPPPWHERVRDALMAIVRFRPPPGTDPDFDFTPDDRETAILVGIGQYATEPDVQALLEAEMTDESEPAHTRVAAIRALAEHQVFGSFEPWRRAAKSADPVVRQALADNLLRTQDRSVFDILQPLHEDENEFVRSSSVETQTARRQSTILPVVHQLLEDWSPEVRFYTLLAVAAFKDEPGNPERCGHVLRMLEESDEPLDVAGAILALSRITGEVYGVREIDVHQLMDEVDEDALEAFVKDADGRREAAAKWRDKFGGAAVYTDGDRRKALEALAQHKDPENRARAEKLLAQ